MDLEWSEEDRAFEKEVRAFLDEQLTDDLRRAGRLQTSVYSDHDLGMEWQRRLHERGWLAPHWPVEHGGCDWSLAQHYIFQRELVRAGAPAVSPMGIHMVAHVIIKFGTPAQKDYFLPRILSGEVFFCQGYSEPGAGSDLASLQMAAVPDGDDFILNGSKIWTTHAGEANWIFCLVRTSKLDRPQKGITFILVNMEAPGVTVRPIIMTSGENVQNQVFFDDVRVPKANVIGEVDDGWSVAKYLLEFERGGNAYSPALKVRVDAIAERAKDKRTAQDGVLADDPHFEKKLTEARMRIDVLEMLELRLLSSAEGGESVGPLASMMKVLGTELQQHLTELALEASGRRGLVYQPHAVMPGGPVPGHEPPADGYVSGTESDALAPLRYMNERAGSIYAGSNEIQRNILAKVLLAV